MLESSREREPFGLRARPNLRIAIDGPASAGKTAVGVLVAKKLGYHFFDTGLVYRALALVAVDKQVDSRDETRLAELARRIEIGAKKAGSESAAIYRAAIDGEDVTARLHDQKISDMASKVSALGTVRASLLELQRKVIEPGAVVAAGRDVGTVVAPEADLKIFLTASPEVRRNGGTTRCQGGAGGSNTARFCRRSSNAMKGTRRGSSPPRCQRVMQSSFRPME